MQVPFFDLSPQHSIIKAELHEAMQNVVAKSNFIGGEEVVAFENSFAHYIGTKFCVGCGNGTDALEVILRALNIKEGDEVLVPALTWISTAEAVTMVGATPVFCDILSDTLNIDPKEIPLKISSKTKAVMVVHLYGLVADMQEICRIAAQFGIAVTEDCAHAHGAMQSGKKAGSFGTAAAFSFYPTKNLGALGDGGAITTSDEALAHRCRMITNHGSIKRDTHLIEGRNSRLDTLQAAILSIKLPYLDRWNAQRILNANRYIASISDMKEIILQSTSDEAVHVYHQYVIRVRNREELQQYLFKKGIRTMVHYPIPVPFIPVYARYAHSKGDFPRAEHACSELLSLPIFPGLSRTSIGYVIKVLKSFFNNF